jgi:hypothetical protein
VAIKKEFNDIESKNYWEILRKRISQKEEELLQTNGCSRLSETESLEQD